MTRIINTSSGSLIATSTTFATNPWQRFRGLMLRSPDDFGEGQALVIDPCTSIHMFFMRFPIDVLYLNRDHEVIRSQQTVRPWRVGPLYTKGARLVIELPEGTIAETQTAVGDQLIIEAPQAK